MATRTSTTEAATPSQVGMFAVSFISCSLSFVAQIANAGRIATIDKPTSLEHARIVSDRPCSSEIVTHQHDSQTFGDESADHRVNGSCGRSVEASRRLVKQQRLPASPQAPVLKPVAAVLRPTGLRLAGRARTQEAPPDGATRKHCHPSAAVRQTSLRCAPWGST